MDLEKILILISIFTFILWGVLLLIKRKLMVSSIVVNILSSSISLCSFISISEVMPVLGIFVLIFSLSMLIFLLHKGRHIVYGVDVNTVSDIIRDILKKEKIIYEEKESLFELKDYDDKCIVYKKSSDSVEVDLDHIRKLPLYDVVRDEIRIRIQEIEENLFPKSGIMYILLGIGLIIFIQYLEKTI